MGPVFGIARLLGLSGIRHWDADKNEQEGVAQRACQQPAFSARCKDDRERDPPPHEYFAKVVRMPRALPQTAMDELSMVVSAKSVHLTVRYGLPCSGAQGQKHKQIAENARSKPVLKGIKRRQHTAIYDERGYQVDAKEIDERVCLPLFSRSIV